jgi:hypothetical protein
MLLSLVLNDDIEDDSLTAMYEIGEFIVQIKQRPSEGHVEHQQEEEVEEVGFRSVDLLRGYICMLSRHSLLRICGRCICSCVRATASSDMHAWPWQLVIGYRCRQAAVMLRHDEKRAASMPWHLWTTHKH